MAKNNTPRKRKSTDVFFRKKLLPLKMELKDSIEQYNNLTKDISRLNFYLRISANLAREIMKPKPSEFYGEMPEGYPELTKEDLDHADLHLYGFVQTQNQNIKMLKDCEGNQVKALNEAYHLINETHKNRKVNPSAYEKMKKDWDEITSEISVKMIEFAAVMEPIGNMMGLVDMLKEQLFLNETLKKRWELFQPIHDAYGKKIEEEGNPFDWFDKVESANEDEIIARWEPIQDELHARLEEHIKSQQPVVVEEVNNSEVPVSDTPEIEDAEITPVEEKEND